MRITPNFSSDEFACHDDSAYPPEWIESRLAPLCETLQVVRDSFARPVSILSGYRSAAWNARIGGASLSQHMQGRAADIRIGGVTPAEVHARVLELHAAGKLPHLGGLGRYLTFCHLDVRPRAAGERLAQWTGIGVAAMD